MRPAKKAARKAPAKRSKVPEKLPVLAPQPHGGAIYVGGVPGHVGAGGRPPNVLRAAMRENLEAVLPKLHAEWQAGELDALDYAQFLAKYTLDARTMLPRNDVFQAMRAIAERVKQGTTPEQYALMEADLQAIARSLEGR